MEHKQISSRRTRSRHSNQDDEWENTDTLAGTIRESKVFDKGNKTGKRHPFLKTNPDADEASTYETDDSAASLRTPTRRHNHPELVLSPGTIVFEQIDHRKRTLLDSVDRYMISSTETMYL